MPRYCQHCILPETRPGVKLDSEGVCQGCRNAETKARLDWSQRAAAFQEVAEHAKSRAQGYDCVIPVSGGKDSYWQVVTCLEHGLHPLCVTYAYPGRTELGEQNLGHLLRLGVDHLEFRTNPRVERIFVEEAFRRHAISGLVTHMAIYSVPIRVAASYDIPLVVYGENSAFEYGSEDDRLTGAQLDHHWLRSFGVTGGTTAEDWIGERLTRDDLTPFFVPPAELLAAKDIKVIFLGYYFHWDPENSLRIAAQHGFRARAEGARVGHVNYVNIDDDLLGVHHHPKWHKFGITRSWDTLSMEIRCGRLSRAEAIEILRKRGDETPWEDIRLFCEFIGMSRDEYFATLESFRNHEVWSRRGDRWVIDDFLVPDFPWPQDPLVDGC
jgi:N-acetyl sugar amidotransferase